MGHRVRAAHNPHPVHAALLLQGHAGWAKGAQDFNINLLRVAVDHLCDPFLALYKEGALLLNPFHSSASARAGVGWQASFFFEYMAQCSLMRSLVALQLPRHAMSRHWQA